MDQNNYIEVQQKKSNKNLIIVIFILILLGVVGVIIYMNGQDEVIDSENKEQNNAIEEIEKSNAFLLRIEDVFVITGRGLAVTGTIERGDISVGDTVQIVGLDKEVKEFTVGTIEIGRNVVKNATAGDTVGIILKDATRDDVEAGQVLAEPNTISAHKKFDADIYLYTGDEGGRHTPFFNNYRPQIYFATKGVTGIIELPEGVEMVNPGDNASVNINLVSSVAIEVGTEFLINEGGKVVGSGKVTKLYD